MNKNTVMIGYVEYIPKSEAIKTEVVTLEDGVSIAARMVGKMVIVRSRNEGINCGIVVCADETGVELRECRRIWYHKPKESLLSWYEGVAISGISDDSTVSGTVFTKTIVEQYSMTECTEGAYKSIMEKTPNAQS